jgi:hypothetical protein
MNDRLLAIAFGKQVFDTPDADIEARLEPSRMLDDLRRKSVSLTDVFVSTRCQRSG